ncbi:NAD(+) diphosphatase [Conexibacter sp. SYSU D00693]|uniref:NAD(+) diphosphatase n=1 Tax=Conexibacter sp. SYSU D00693 TaxID=2812560 RepID=UPI00196B2200|nr:NAD(+) diphosphatase [Conexibacter sp. SYSU D00693]
MPLHAPIVPTFAGGTLDRAGHRRTDAAWQEQARQDASARVVVVGRAGIGVTDGPAGPDAIFLGLDGERPVFARAADGGDGSPVELRDLRGLAARADAAEAGLLAHAQAMVGWHAATAFCGRCGTATQAGEAGHVRTCANGHQHHPRTDPVVIVVVADREGDRLLLGRQPSWPAGRFSALAGFVEPGETLEAAVAREVAEEAGVAVRDVRYVAGQPWPFPANLMLGFEATWDGGEAHVADPELEAVRWFTREEVAAAARHEEPWPTEGAPPPPQVETDLILPPSMAIARDLVDGWLAAGA